MNTIIKAVSRDICVRSEEVASEKCVTCKQMLGLRFM